VFIVETNTMKYRRKFRTVSHYFSRFKNNNTSIGEQISNKKFLAAEEAEVNVTFLQKETPDTIRANFLKHT
jgi:hypothetical protein